MSDQRDIIERLRDRTGYWHSMLRNEAADEIASLRARVAEMQYEAGMYRSLYELAQGRLASARKALEEITNIGEGSTTANSLPHIAKIARSALTDELRAPAVPGVHTAYRVISNYLTKCGGKPTSDQVWEIANEIAESTLSSAQREEGKS